MNTETGQTSGGFVELLEGLRVRDFMPGDSGEWFDLPVGAVGMVRVALDDGEVAVHVLSGNGVSFWQVSLSDGTPVGVVTGGYRPGGGARRVRGRACVGLTACGWCRAPVLRRSGQSALNGIWRGE